jgi:hypothetical protein
MWRQARADGREGGRGREREGEGGKEGVGLTEPVRFEREWGQDVFIQSSLVSTSHGPLSSGHRNRLQTADCRLLAMRPPSSLSSQGRLGRWK